LLTYVIETSDVPLRLSLTRSNRAARTLYESLGFEVTEAFEGKMYGRAIPAMRMVLRREADGDTDHVPQGR
ncbi:MAG: hypothetical protein GY851_29905, partial [bacterium]|nr:hypothetical protein [bacterium]